MPLLVRRNTPFITFSERDGLKQQAQAKLAIIKAKQQGILDYLGNNKTREFAKSESGLLDWKWPELNLRGQARFNQFVRLLD